MSPGRDWLLWALLAWIASISGMAHGGTQVDVHASKDALMTAAGGVLRQVDLEDLSAGSTTQLVSRVITVAALGEPPGVLFITQDSMLHAGLIGIIASSPTMLGTQGARIELPRGERHFGFWLRSEGCLAEPVPLSWRLLDAAGNELASGAQALDDGCPVPGDLHPVYIGWSSSVAFHAVEFSRGGLLQWFDDLAFAAVDVDLSLSAEPLPGERQLASFDELSVPLTAPFDSGGLSFSGGAQVWDDFVGFTHSQIFGGQATPPNFVLTNLRMAATTSTPADGLELQARTICIGAATMNLMMQMGGNQVDYLAVPVLATGPLQLSQLRLYDRLQVDGAALGNFLCNLMLDDLTLVRTHLFQDDFESGLATQTTGLSPSNAWSAKRDK